MASSFSLNFIIRELLQHQEATRIKKLLVYTVENRWVSDPEILENIDLKPIVQSLLAQYASINEFQERLSSAVSSLSRPAAYSRIANTILIALNPLFKDETETTRVLSLAPPPLHLANISNKTIANVAEKLDTHPEEIRIKKLLYAMCYRRWENNFEILGAFNFVQLLKQVKTRYPVYKKFQQKLDKLVSSLNRRSIYAQIAEAILETIMPIYGGAGNTTNIIAAPAVSLAEDTPPSQGSNDKGTMTVEDPQLDSAFGEGQQISQQNVFPDEVYQAEEFSSSNSGNTGIVGMDESVGGIGTGTQLAVAPRAVTETPIKNTPEKSLSLADGIDPHQLKLEIFKYANPLRVKILLFSTVHHVFDLSGRDWSMLRTCDFDDLLLQTVSLVSTPIALEIKLSAVAQSLFEPEEYLQATSAIIQAINSLKK